jgi:quercetin dioxygenase-like cupin family protein
MSMRGSTSGLRVVLSAAAMLSGFAATWQAAAEDAVAVAPGQYKVEYEDSDVRVLRVLYGPGGKSAMHHHPDSVAVYLTGGHIRITLPDGRVGEPRVPPGKTMRHPAGSHTIENLADEPFEMVLVELKKSPDASSPLATPRP